MEMLQYRDEDFVTDNVIDSSSSSFLIIPRTNNGFLNDHESREIATTSRSHQSNDQFYHSSNNMSAVRDTSDTSRHIELSNTRDSISISNNSNIRQSISGVNTHDSILDLEESQHGENDDDDDDTFPICEEMEEDDENMIGIMGDEFPSNIVLLDDDSDNDNNELNHLNIFSPGTQPAARAVSPSPCTERKDMTNSTIKSNSRNPDIKKKKKKSKSIMGNLTLYSVTDSFFDSLCTSTACVVSDTVNSGSVFDSCPVDRSYWQSSSKQRQRQKAASSKSSPSLSSSSSRARDDTADEQSMACNTVVSMDIWQLLGCTNPPGESEMEEIWSLRTTKEMLRRGQRQKQQESFMAKPGPARASIRRRLKRIHRLRMDGRRRVCGASRHGVTITNESYDLDQSYTNLNNIRKDVHMNKNGSNGNSKRYSHQTDNLKHHQLQQPSYYRTIDKSYSMMDDSLSNFIGQGMIDPIPVEFEPEDQEEQVDGYDSDPEVMYYSASSSMIISDLPASQSQLSSAKRDVSSSEVHLSSATTNPTDYMYSEQQQHHHPKSKQLYPIPMNQTEMKHLVQQTLNSTWTLTWYPNLENRKKFKISHNKPICINMWLERGTVITSSGVVVEPAFMWRDAYQPLLLSQHKLNNSTQKPWSMRLLNACRVTPFLPNSCPIDRMKYPVARQKSSFLLKSCDGDEFLLEAKCSDDAIAISERWKLVVARFASLAVTEDVGGISKEFFHPTSESQMLTISDEEF